MTSGADFNELERQQAKRDGAQLVKNSGRGQKKGDAILGDQMVDYKFTSKNSYAINLAKYNDLRKQAWAERKSPVTVAIFTESKDQAIAICDWEYLKSLVKEIDELKDELKGAIREIGAIERELSSERNLRDY